MAEQIVEMLESFVRESTALIVNSCFNVFMEIFKFFVILLILYNFTLWSFQVLDQLSLAAPIRANLDPKSYLQTEYGSKTQTVVSETFLRIGAPDEKLIRQRASLLEQLEIEAEFEEKIKQHLKTEGSINHPEIPTSSLTTRSSNEIVQFKDLFISQKKYEANETSRPSQTAKTSLGKKSKPREGNFGSGPEASPTLTDQPEGRELWPDINVDGEFDADATRTTSTEHETTSSDDEQKDRS